MKYCQNCAKEFANDAVFCPHCGNGLVDKAQEYVCPKCGYNLGGSFEQYCPNCGQPFYTNQAESSEHKKSSTKYVIIAASIIAVLAVLFMGNQVKSTSVNATNTPQNVRAETTKDQQFNPFLEAGYRKLGIRKKNVASVEYFPKSPIDRIAKAQAEKIATDYFGTEQKLFYLTHRSHNGPPESMFYMYALPNAVSYQGDDKMRYWMITIGMDPLTDSHKIAVLDCYLANGQTNEQEVVAERVIFPGRPVYDNKERVGEISKLFSSKKVDRLNEFLATDWRSEK